MRSYIRKKELDSTLTELVDQRDNQLLEICCRLSKFRKEGQDDYVENMLYYPTEVLLFFVDVLLTVVAFFLIARLIAMQVSPLGLILLGILSFVLIVYLARRTVRLVKKYKEARSYLLVDELIERDMLEIGIIYPDV